MVSAGSCEKAETAIVRHIAKAQINFMNALIQQSALYLKLRQRKNIDGVVSDHCRWHGLADEFERSTRRRLCSARKHHNVLLAIDGICDRAVDDHAADDGLPQDLARVRVESAETPVEITEKNQVAGSCEC